MSVISTAILFVINSIEAVSSLFNDLLKSNCIPSKIMFSFSSFAHKYIVWLWTDSLLYVSASRNATWFPSESEIELIYTNSAFSVLENAYLYFLSV